MPVPSQGHYGFHSFPVKYFWHFCWLPYLYTFSLCENASFIIVSAETEYISTRSWYRNINFWFGALKSDSTHHFFRNACTKSGSLRFSQFSSWLILSVYILMSFEFPFVRLFGVRCSRRISQSDSRINIKLNYSFVLHTVKPGRTYHRLDLLFAQQTERCPD
jgi:hypothetical protein